MQFEFSKVLNWPLHVLGLIVVVIIGYHALNFLVSVEAREHNKPLSFVLAALATVFIYREADGIGWIRIPIGLLAGVLILLLGEAIAEADEAEEKTSASAQE
ncbi:MAG TPA: hypothetical protein PKL83_01710 [bacterium]|nr:hypothetical protein [bacterium]